MIGQCFTDPEQQDPSSMIVVVTHVENPTLFYCRLDQDQNRYEELFRMIQQRVDSTLNPMVPEISSLSSNLSLLVYSIIHNVWCRGRLISLKFDKNMKPVSAKVWLIDFGSIEFVSWKSDFIISSTPEIDDYNNTKGLCFACCLYNIKPLFDGVGNFHHDWTSYANYIFKKEANHNKFRLEIIQQPTSMNTTAAKSNPNDKIVICDLYPIFHHNSQQQYGTMLPLSHYLVETKVAQFIDKIDAQR